MDISYWFREACESCRFSDLWELMERNERNEIMFWIGIAIIVTISILMLAVKEDISLGVIGIIGILFISASQYRPLKNRYVSVTSEFLTVRSGSGTTSS